MSSREPTRLSDGERPTAALLEEYAAHTRELSNDDRAAWQRLQPALDARLPSRRPWAQTRLLAGAFTVALGLFVLARSAMLSPERVPAGPTAARRATESEGSLGGGGASGSLDGDSRGAGGMEGASGGARRASDGV
ncbi:MAG: hypothetical protein ABJA82_15665 [Myxococcales bacterium]